MIERACALLRAGEYTCVAIDVHGDVYTSTQRGVSPLIAWLDEGLDLRGGVAADKVIGNGAAHLYILLGVSAVHGCVMSEPAQATLRTCGIDARTDTLVEHIVNRAGDGFCPMELAVAGITDSHEALAALRARLAHLVEASASAR